MQVFRELIKGWLGKVFLAVVIIIFAAFGTESLLTLASKPAPAAEVNSVELSQAYLDSQIDAQRQYLQSRMQAEGDSSEIDPLLLREQVLNSLIQRELLRQYSKQADLVFPESKLYEAIVGMEQFQQDGRFVQSLLDQFLRRYSLTAAEFKTELATDRIINQIRIAFQESNFITQSQLKRLLVLEQQERDIKYLLVRHDQLHDQVEVSEEEIAQYYEQNRSLYVTKTQAQLNFIEIYADRFKSEVVVSDEELQLSYRDYVQQFKAQEERSARHILVQFDDVLMSGEQQRTEQEAREKIEKIQQDLKQGTDFIELAKLHSEDKGSAAKGGDLGFVKRGDLVAGFEEALFFLEQPNEVSDIVQTEFGFHLIQLVAIKEQKIPSFKSVKEKLETDLITLKSNQMFSDRLEEWRTLVYESGDLQPLADSLGEKIKTGQWLTKGEPEAKGIFSNPKVFKAAFSEEVLIQGYNSELIELESGRAVVVRLQEHRPVAVLPLSKVKEKIKRQLIVSQAKEKVDEIGREIIAKLRTSDPDPNQLAAEYHLEWQEVLGIKRLSSKVAPEIRKKTFSLPRPEFMGTNVISGVVLQNGDFAVLQLLKVNEVPLKLTREELLDMQKFLANRLGEQLFNDFLRDQELQANIKIMLEDIAIQ